MERVIQSHIQGMKHEYENLTMAKNDSVMDFTMKFTQILFELQNLGENLEELEVVRRFLRATPSKFDAIILSLQ